MKRSKLLKVFLVLALVVVFAAGCSTGVTDDDDVYDDDVTDQETVDLEGFVAVNRQGEEIDDDAGNITIRIDGNDESYTTDEDGQFAIELETGETYDIVASREGLATTKVQNLYVDENNPAEELMILINKEGPKDYDYDIADLTVEGVENFENLADITEVTVESDNPMYELHVDMNNNPRKDYEVWGTIIDAGFEMTVQLDLTPNYGGDNQMLVVFAVDPSNNIVMEYFHLEMPDIAAGDLPAAPDYLEAQASTYRFSQNLLSVPDEVEAMMASENLSPDTMPEGTMLWNTLYWETPEDSDAEAFNIYRSLDGENYSLIDTTSSKEFRDIHPQVEPGQEVFYRVYSLNQSGESNEYMEISVEPLPVFYISLISPQNKEENVSLEPEFKWEVYNMNKDYLNLDEVTYIFDFMIRRGTRNYDDLRDPFYGWHNAMLYVGGFNGEIDYTLRDLINLDLNEEFNKKNLVRDETYEWGLNEAFALRVQIDDEEEGLYSEAISYGALGSFAIPDNSLPEFRTID